MNKFLVIYLVFAALLAYSCSKSIIIPDAKLNSSIYQMFGETSSRDFVNAIELKDSLRLKWKAEINGGFSNTSIVCLDDFVFTPDLSGRVYCFKISTGKKVGHMSYKGSIIAAPIINQSKIIYAVAKIKDNETEIVNYDFKMGKVVKSINVKGRVQTELLKVDNSIIFITEEGRMFSYPLSLSDINWEYESKIFVHTSPVLSSNSIIFGNDKGEIISLGAQSGKLNYRVKISNGFEGGFSASGDSVFAADKSGMLFCINAKDGKVLWSFNSGTRITNFPVVNNSSIYLSNLKGDLIKITRSGSKEWRVSTDGVLNVTPLVFNNTIVQPDYNKKVYLIDSKNGTIKKTLTFDDRVRLNPVFYRDVLFIGTDNGKLYAFENIN